MTADQIRSLQPALAALLNRFRRCFKKEATFSHWQCYLLGLMADLRRKSIEPIALAAGVPVRTLQEFLSQFAWDHHRASTRLQQWVMDEHGCEGAIGVIDGSGHHKQGTKTPGANGVVKRAKSTTASSANTCCIRTTMRRTRSRA